MYCPSLPLPFLSLPPLALLHDPHPQIHPEHLLCLLSLCLQYTHLASRCSASFPNYNHHFQDAFSSCSPGKLGLNHLHLSPPGKSSFYLLLLHLISLFACLLCGVTMSPTCFPPISGQLPAPFPCSSCSLISFPGILPIYESEPNGLASPHPSCPTQAVLKINQMMLLEQGLCVELTRVSVWPLAIPPGSSHHPPDY